jgi:UDPglucose--hexose-1-phosphate uridylyltransferase
VQGVSLSRSVLRRSLSGLSWSIIAPERSSRPQVPTTRKVGEDPVRCPFCEGNESETEPEVFALRETESPDGPGWTLRVVPNKFPALRSDASTHTLAASLHEQAPATGFHEVVIETPDHNRRMARFSLLELDAALAVYQSRVSILSHEAGVQSLALFRNDGIAAGATQLHPHTQILALPIVPGQLQADLDSAQRHYRARGQCQTCELVETSGRRNPSCLIAANADFIAVASGAARFPYETWIVPKLHSHDFRECRRDHLRSLAEMLGRVLGALESTVGSFPFNLVLHTAPMCVSRPIPEAVHWRLEILPRLTTPSGLELGFGVYIVSVPPEEAARRLRLALEAPASTTRPI